MELILSVGKIKQQSTDPNTRTRSDQTALIKADPPTSPQPSTDLWQWVPYLWTPAPATHTSFVSCYTTSINITYLV